MSMRWSRCVSLVVAGVCAGSAVYGSEGGGADPFGWSTDLALWTLIIFGITLGILWKYAFGPIAQALDAREKSVADDVAAAKQANADAKELLAEYQRKLDEAQAEVRQILAAAKADAQRVADGLIQQARDAAKQQQERALQDIDAAKMQALQELARMSATLATELAAKMIKREIKADNHHDLIDAALQSFPRA
ncbi:MAG: F0F1 ATP synthase subunit B [Thermoguttaceae bacterium]